LLLNILHIALIVFCITTLVVNFRAALIHFCPHVGRNKANPILPQRPRKRPACRGDSKLPQQVVGLISFLIFSPIPLCARYYHYTPAAIAQVRLLYIQEAHANAGPCFRDEPHPRLAPCSTQVPKIALSWAGALLFVVAAVVVAVVVVVVVFVVVVVVGL